MACVASRAGEEVWMILEPKESSGGAERTTKKGDE
jgi:hypothetical protein